MKKKLISIGAAMTLFASGFVPMVHAETLTTELTGKVLQFGTYAGQPIKYVIGGSRDVNGDGEEELFLYSKNFVSVKAYSANNVADWRKSTLRTWMNSDQEYVEYSEDNTPSYASQPGYLNGFSENEKKMIVPQTHKTLISGSLNPDGGQNTIGWTDTWPGVLDNAVGDLDIDTAYYALTTDYAFLPSLLDMRDYGILPTGDFNAVEEECLNVYGETASDHGWIRDATMLDNDNARFWYAYNAVTSGVVSLAKGVRVCMYVRQGQTLTGAGTDSNPYKIAFPFSINSVTMSNGGEAVTDLTDGETTFTVNFHSLIDGERLSLYAVRYESENGSIKPADLQRQELTTTDGENAGTITMNVENADSSYVKVFICGEDGSTLDKATVFGTEPEKEIIEQDKDEMFWVEAGAEGFNVTIHGKEKTSPFASVTAVVSKSAGEGEESVLYADTQKIAADGSFDFSFLAEKAFIAGGVVGGWYDVKIYSNFSETPVTTQVGIAGAGLFLDTIQNFKTLEAENIAKILLGADEYMLEHNSMLGKDLFIDDIKTQEVADKVAQKLKENVPTDGYTEENFKEIFNKIVTGVLFDEAEDKFEILETDRYAEILNSGDITKKAAYQKIKENRDKVDIWSTINSENVAEKLSETIVITALEIAENANDAKTIIEESADEIGISFGSTYEKLSASQMKKLYDALVGGKYSNYAAVKSKWESAYSEATKTSQSSSGSSSGSSHSGSGSGGSSHSSVPVTGMEKPQAEPGKTPENVIFSDVEQLSWGKTEIIALAQMGIVSGMENGRFEPTGKVTREQFAKMAAGAFGISASTESDAFTDVLDGAWYAEAVRSMSAAGYILGISEDKFGVGENITRQDIAVILYRILKDKIYDADKELSFSDAEDISDYAKDAAAALYCSGIISGYDDGSFGAKREVTRQEAAVMIYRAINLK